VLTVQTKFRPKLQNQTIVIGDWVLSPWSEILQKSSACAWQCMSFSQLCLYWSCKSFQNTCIWPVPS